MTYGQLFREITMEAFKRHGQTLDEIHCKLAETVMPESVNDEVPEDLVEIYRAMGAKEADAFIEGRKNASHTDLSKYLSAN